MYGSRTYHKSRDQWQISKAAAGMGKATSGKRMVVKAAAKTASKLKEREYRDEQGNIHHHTREYLQAHPEDKGRPPRSKQGEGNGDGNGHR
jgi:hypothetical protein